MNEKLEKERKRKRDVAESDLVISEELERFARFEKEGNELHQKVHEHQQNAEAHDQKAVEHEQKATEARTMERRDLDKADEHQQKATEAIAEAMKSKEKIRKHEKKKEALVRDGLASDKAIQKAGEALTDELVSRYGLRTDMPTCTSILPDK
jgi:hypothetical protein